jgi:hypothetical protein
MNCSDYVLLDGTKRENSFSVLINKSKNKLSRLLFSLDAYRRDFLLFEVMSPIFTRFLDGDTSVFYFALDPVSLLFI